MPGGRVVLVTQEGCNPCFRVKRLLDQILGETEDVEVREVQLSSEEGAELAVRHNILFPPAVIVDGRLVAKGKVLEKDLRLALGAPPTAPR